jgi:hypothetical protein
MLRQYSHLLPNNNFSPEVHGGAVVKASAFHFWDRGVGISLRIHMYLHDSANALPKVVHGFSPFLPPQGKLVR